MIRRYKLVLRIPQLKRRWIVKTIDLPIKSTFKDGFKIRLTGDVSDTVMSEISFRKRCHIKIPGDEYEFSLYAHEPVTKLYDSQLRSFVKLMNSIKSSERVDIFTEAKARKRIQPRPL